jgi:phosphatidylserine/phosphatidylglycerophosphate/cardiolipin synthase-like enzyme
MSRRSARRASSFVLLLLVLALAFAFRSYPRLKSWLVPAQRVEPSFAPVIAPGTAAVEGPYFSDGDRVAERIIAAVNHTQKFLHVAIYDLTHPEIAAALASARRRGVEIRIVADERQSLEPHSEIPYLRSQGVSVRLSRGYKGDRSIMHNKFAVFDGRLAETGSFNWTTSADRYNYENALFIADPAVVSRFENEFDLIWSQAR